MDIPILRRQGRIMEIYCYICKFRWKKQQIREIGGRTASAGQKPGDMDEKTEKDILQDIASQEYEHGFVTDVEQEFIPKGLNEDIIRLISSKKHEPQWLLDFRLDAFRRWQKMKMPAWAHLQIPEIDFQDIIYYAAPKKDSDRPTEIYPEL